MSDTTKLGWIVISNELLAKAPDLFEKHFADVTKVVCSGVEITHRELHGIAFLCICDEFDPIPNGSRDVPEYLFTFDRNPDGTSTRRPVEKLS